MSKHFQPRSRVRKAVSAFALTAAVASGFALLQAELQVSPSEAHAEKPSETAVFG